MNIHEFRRMVDNIADSVPEYSDKEVTVMVMPNNGEVFGSISSTKVTGIIPGFDWDDWQIIIHTEDRLIKYDK